MKIELVSTTKVKTKSKAECCTILFLGAGSTQICPAHHGYVCDICVDSGLQIFSHIHMQNIGIVDSAALSIDQKRLYQEEIW